MEKSSTGLLERLASGSSWGMCLRIKMYSDANSTINGIYQSVNRKSNKGATANIDAQEPFSVLLMGLTQAI